MAFTCGNNLAIFRVVCSHKPRLTRQPSVRRLSHFGETEPEQRASRRRFGDVHRPIETIGAFLSWLERKSIEEILRRMLTGLREIGLQRNLRRASSEGFGIGFSGTHAGEVICTYGKHLITS